VVGFGEQPRTAYERCCCRSKLSHNPPTYGRLNTFGLTYKTRLRTNLAVEAYIIEPRPPLTPLFCVYTLLATESGHGGPLGLAAGVIGIAATGFAVARGLYQIADGIGSAGQEVRIYADEVDAFSELLKMVRAELLRSSSVSLDEQSLVKDVMDVCDRVLQPLNRLQGTLRPLLVRFRTK
jgi:hypothetical protein